MAKQLLAKERARNLVIQYRKDSLPYDIEQFITLAIQDAEKAATEAEQELMECGHPKACFHAAHHFVAGGKDNQTCARCRDDIHLHIPKSEPYCSSCAELGQARTRVEEE